MSDLSIYKIIIYVSCFVAAIVFFLTSNDINFGKEVTEMTIEILITTVVSIIIIIILKSGRELTDEKVIQNNKLLEQQKENDTLILYLRDFAVDGIKIKKLHVGNIKTEFMDTNFETELSLIVSRVGRLIAVGINSPAGDVGSYRYHTNDVNWKKEVSYLMQKSSMILLRPAYSPGLIWELEEIVKNGYLPKTVICYNKRQDGILNYSDFRYATKRFIKLPPFIFVSRYMWFNDQLKLQKTFVLEKIPLYKELLLKEDDRLNQLALNKEKSYTNFPNSISVYSENEGSVKVTLLLILLFIFTLGLVFYLKWG